jgi:hypothetical protein
MFTLSLSRVTRQVLPPVEIATRCPVAASSGSSDQSPASMMTRISSTPSTASSASTGVGVPIASSPSIRWTAVSCAIRLAQKPTV